MKYAIGLVTACALFYAWSSDAPIGDSFADDLYQPKGAVADFSDFENAFYVLGDLTNTLINEK